MSHKDTSRKEVIAARPVWARHAEVKRLTGCPEKWLADFAKKHPENVRKFGNGNSNGTLIFNVAAVLKAIDKGV